MQVAASTAYCGDSPLEKGLGSLRKLSFCLVLGVHNRLDSVVGQLLADLAAEVLSLISVTEQQL